jgi:hypothetical protein
MFPSRWRRVFSHTAGTGGIRWEVSRKEREEETELLKHGKILDREETAVWQQEEEGRGGILVEEKCGKRCKGQTRSRKQAQKKAD